MSRPAASTSPHQPCDQLRLRWCRKTISTASAVPAAPAHRHCNLVSWVRKTPQDCGIERIIGRRLQRETIPGLEPKRAMAGAAPVVAPYGLASAGAQAVVSAARCWWSSGVRQGGAHKPRTASGFRDSRPTGGDKPTSQPASVVVTHVWRRRSDKIRIKCMHPPRRNARRFFWAGITTWRCARSQTHAALSSFELLHLFGCGLDLVLGLPFLEGMPYTTVRARRNRERARVPGRCQIPLRQAVAAEAGEVHEVDCSARRCGVADASQSRNAAASSSRRACPPGGGAVKAAGIAVFSSEHDMGLVLELGREGFWRLWIPKSSIAGNS